MSTDSNVVEYRSVVHSALQASQFFVANTSPLALTSTAGTMSVIMATVLPTVSSAAEDYDDITEGLKGLTEPTVATWDNVKAQLGL
jgi:hypothetical protein